MYDYNVIIMGKVVCFVTIVVLVHVFFVDWMDYMYMYMCVSLAAHLASSLFSFLSLHDQAYMCFEVCS